MIRYRCPCGFEVESDNEVLAGREWRKHIKICDIYRAQVSMLDDLDEPQGNYLRQEDASN